MISRLTDTEPASWPTVDEETMIRHSTEDGADITDVAPIGWYGATFYPEDGLLVFTYRKHGNSFADQEDEDGEIMGDRADTGLGLLTVDRVASLVQAAISIGRQHPDGQSWTLKDAETWVLNQIEHGTKR